jgi:putative transposase
VAHGREHVITRRHKRRKEVAELLETLLEQHPRGTVYVAWDNASTPEDDEVEAVLRGAAGRLVLLYLPTYSPWLNPAEMQWRQLRREVTHCELFESIDALLDATRAFFDRLNQTPGRALSIIGANPT